MDGNERRIRDVLEKLEAALRSSPDWNCVRRNDREWSKDPPAVEYFNFTIFHHQPNPEN